MGLLSSESSGPRRCASPAKWRLASRQSPSLDPRLVQRGAAAGRPPSARRLVPLSSSSGQAPTLRTFCAAHGAQGDGTVQKRGLLPPRLFRVRSVRASGDLGLSSARWVELQRHPSLRAQGRVCCLLPPPSALPTTKRAGHTGSRQGMRASQATLARVRPSARAACERSDYSTRARACLGQWRQTQAPPLR